MENSQCFADRMGSKTSNFLYFIVMIHGKPPPHGTMIMEGINSLKSLALSLKITRYEMDLHYLSYKR